MMASVSTWEERMSARHRPVAAGKVIDEALAMAAIEAGKLRTPELAEQERRDYCADCSEVFRDGHHGWRVRLTCGGPGRCTFGHAHHDDEVWQA